MPLSRALAVFAEKAETPHWVVAVSGGADSALLWELACRQAIHCTGVRVVAFYLHHYPTAPEPERMHALQFLAERARSVLKDRFELFCTQCDIATRAVRLRRSWEHTASLIRRRMLEKFARQRGKAVVFTGHTLSDYAETLQLRKERQIPQTAWPQPGAHDEVTGFCRPLYYMTREEVREHARARGLLWYDDPANANTAIARNRIRLALKNAPAPSAPAPPSALQPLHFQRVHYRELRLRYNDWSKLEPVVRARLIYRGWQKLGIVKKFTRNDFARAQRLPFALPPYFVHAEESAGTRWIIFRRGLGAVTREHSPALLQNSLRGHQVTRSLKIRMPYGHKSVAKILSERRLSPRQRRLTRVLLNPTGNEATAICFPDGDSA